MGGGSGGGSGVGQVGGGHVGTGRRRRARQRGQQALGLLVEPAVHGGRIGAAGRQAAQRITGCNPGAGQRQVVRARPAGDQRCGRPVDLHRLPGVNGGQAGDSRIRRGGPRRWAVRPGQIGQDAVPTRLPMRIHQPQPAAARVQMQAGRRPGVDLQQADLLTVEHRVQAAQAAQAELGHQHGQRAPHHAGRRCRQRHRPHHTGKGIRPARQGLHPLLVKAEQQRRAAVGNKGGRHRPAGRHALVAGGGRQRSRRRAAG